MRATGKQTKRAISLLLCLAVLVSMLAFALSVRMLLLRLSSNFHKIPYIVSHFLGFVNKMIAHVFLNMRDSFAFRGFRGKNLRPPHARQA